MSLDFAPPQCLRVPLNVPDRLLMGPGPSNCTTRVLEACARPVMGLWHEEFHKVMDDIKAGIQYVFQTRNAWTLALSGPGHMAMEAVMVNLLEPGELVVIGVHGIWGERASIMAERCGARVYQLKRSPGTSFTYAELEQALSTQRPKLLFLVHSESSTGVMQNLEGVGELCQRYNCLLAVDTVASLGGVPFFMDRWKIDAMYTGSQKVIGAPPGMAPMSFGPRAVAAIKTRGQPPRSYFLDMNMLAVYWDCNGDGAPRAYHHTPPITLFCGLREALAQMGDEGLEAMWVRHAQAAQRLVTGLRAMGCEFYVENEAERLPTVTAVKVPAGVDWKRVTQYGMDKQRLVEIAGGLGPTMGKIFRIGLMGANAYPDKVDRLLQVFKEGLQVAKTQAQGRL